MGANVEKGNTFEDVVIQKIDAERLAQQIIDQSCKRKGWSMRKVVQTVREKMGNRAAFFARDYMVQKYAL